MARFVAAMLGVAVLAGLPAWLAARPHHTDAGASLVEQRPDGSIALFDGRVIPPMPKLLDVRQQFERRLEWLEQKHAALLPMMRKHGVGMWVVVNEEFHDDPATEYIAPDLVYVSRRDITSSSTAAARDSSASPATGGPPPAMAASSSRSPRHIPTAASKRPRPACAGCSTPTRRRPSR
jgi:hypothetical protein